MAYFKIYLLLQFLYDLNEIFFMSTKQVSLKNVRSGILIYCFVLKKHEFKVQGQIS